MFKVKVPGQNGIAEFNGISHGLQFHSGISEEFKDAELKDRLVFKGYILIESGKAGDNIDKMKIEALIAFATEKGIVIDESLKIGDMRKAVREGLEAGQ